ATARQLHEAFRILAALQGFNYEIWNRRRLLAIAHQPRNSEGRVTRTPNLRRHVDANKHVAGKQWSGDGFDAARVAAALAITRQGDRDNLSPHVRGSARFPL